MSRTIRNRHPRPAIESMTFVQAKAGLHSHVFCDDGCEAKEYYEKAVRDLGRGRAWNWNIWRVNR